MNILQNNDWNFFDLSEAYNLVKGKAHNRAQNNGRSTDNVRPDRGPDPSNSRLAGHFDRSYLDACCFNAFCPITL